MKLNNRILLPIGIVFISSLGLGTLTFYVLKEPHAFTPATQPLVHSSPLQSKPESSLPPQSQAVYAYLPKMTKVGIVFDQVTISTEKSSDPMAAAMNEFLADSHIVPSDARCVGTKVIQGVAHVSFNDAFRQTYGSFDEKMLIDGIRRNASQFPDVQSVSIEVNGQPIETLGSADLSTPLPPLTENQDLFSNSDSDAKTDTDSSPSNDSSQTKP